MQRNLAAGELAPALHARTDQQKYASGLRTARNVFVMRSGGVTNRPGTEYIAEVANFTAVRLLPFVYNDAQTYVIELGAGYLRLFQNGGRVLRVTSAPAWTTLTGYEGGVVRTHGGRYYVARGAHTSGASTEPGVGGSWATVWFRMALEGGSSVFELPTPYTADDLRDIQYTQSADVLTLVHGAHPPMELRRLGHDDWTLTEIEVGSATAAPAGLSVTDGVDTGNLWYWVVTAVAEETGEESLASALEDATAHDPDPLDPATVSWATVVGAASYNVYRSKDGASFGFVGAATGTSFQDFGLTPDYTIAPPQDRDPFVGAGKYPGVVGTYQQRRVFARATDDPEKVWASRTGLYRNFGISSPLQDTDAVTFSLAGRQVNEVRHILDLGQLILFTSAGEWVIEGDQAGVLRPGEINPRQYAYNGAARRPEPLVVDATALYVQARGSVVRDLNPYSADGYQGTDLSIFASHLFDGYTIDAWAYQKMPHSVVWAARSDGALLALTYLREHQIWGWTRHDTATGAGPSVVEQVCVVPEGTEDRVYLVVRRDIEGQTRRYIERLASRQVRDTDRLTDAHFVDAGLVYDGRHTGSVTMTLTGNVDAPAWDEGENLVCTASEATFVEGDVGNAVHLTAADGTEIRARIEGYVSPTVVLVRPHRLVPVDLRNAATTAWAKAVDRLLGLEHLEGEAVSVLADGVVAACPGHPDHEPVVVTAGEITLSRPYAHLRVGLPITADIETLDLDTPSGASVKGATKLLVNKVVVLVNATRGLWAGQRAPTTESATNRVAGLFQPKARTTEAPGEPVALTTGKMEVAVGAVWNDTGRVFLRQIEPLPMTVLAIAPHGDLQAP